MTYTVSGGALNSTHSLTPETYKHQQMHCQPWQNFFKLWLQIADYHILLFFVLARVAWLIVDVYILYWNAFRIFTEYSIQLYVWLML